MFIIQATGGSMGPGYVYNFYLVENHKDADNLTTVEANEKINTDFEFQ